MSIKKQTTELKAKFRNVHLQTVDLSHVDDRFCRRLRGKLNYGVYGQTTCRRTWKPRQTSVGLEIAEMVDCLGSRTHVGSSGFWFGPSWVFKGSIIDENPMLGWDIGV